MTGVFAQHGSAQTGYKPGFCVFALDLMAKVHPGFRTLRAVVPMTLTPATAAH